MYIPKHFDVADLEEIFRFVGEVRSADLVTVDLAGLPIATLLPCTWNLKEAENSGYGTLVMHMARANQQWKAIEVNSNALAIVHGPQAYISSTNYEGKFIDHKVVPTWNYQSVHLSGKVEISHDIELLRKIVTDLSDQHESKRTNPWRVADADPKYLEAQLHGIVAVILHIEKVEAKYKLSQNRSVTDRENVILDLATSNRSEDRAIATEMKKTLT